MSRKPTRILTAAVALLAAQLFTPAHANDSVAGMALGGLQLLRTDAIVMAEEVLHITPDRVQVRYVFRNVTEKPVETLVAFPLPALGYPDEFAWVPLPVEDDANYVGFTTSIDGVRITPNLESRASLLGIDITARLRQLDVPLVPFHWEVPDRIAALPAATRQALRDDLLIDAENRPLWVLETSFWRRQSFPPGTDVVVEHSYTPVRGGSAMSPVGNADTIIAPDEPGGDWVAEARRRYCIEPELEAEMNRRRLVGAVPGTRHFGSSDIGYVLTTGANWHGSIGRFRLIVEAPHTADFVFLCLDGARRVAGNRIEADLRDFWPWHDLEILFAHLWGEDVPRDD